MKRKQKHHDHKANQEKKRSVWACGDIISQAISALPCDLLRECGDIVDQVIHALPRDLLRIVFQYCKPFAGKLQRELSYDGQKTGALHRLVSSGSNLLVLHKPQVLLQPLHVIVFDTDTWKQRFHFSLPTATCAYAFALDGDTFLFQREGDFCIMQRNIKVAEATDAPASVWAPHTDYIFQMIALETTRELVTHTIDWVHDECDTEDDGTITIYSLDTTKALRSFSMRQNAQFITGDWIFSSHTRRCVRLDVHTGALMPVPSFCKNARAVVIQKAGILLQDTGQLWSHHSSFVSFDLVEVDSDVHMGIEAGGSLVFAGPGNRLRVFE